MANLNNWLKPLLALQEGKQGVCPNCGKKNLESGYVRIKDESGFGAIWCNDCKAAFLISKANLSGKKNILQELPKGLKFGGNQ